MKRLVIKLIPGDGIGIDVVKEAVRVLKALAEKHGGIACGGAVRVSARQGRACGKTAEAGDRDPRKDRAEPGRFFKAHGTLLPFGPHDDRRQMTEEFSR